MEITLKIVICAMAYGLAKIFKHCKKNKLLKWLSEWIFLIALVWFVFPIPRLLQSCLMLASIWFGLGLYNYNK